MVLVVVSLSSWCVFIRGVFRSAKLLMCLCAVLFSFWGFCGFLLDFPVADGVRLGRLASRGLRRFVSLDESWLALSAVPYARFLLEFGNGDLDFTVGVAGRMLIDGIVELKLLRVLGGLGSVRASLVSILGFECLLVVLRSLFEGRGEGGGVGSCVLGGCGSMIVEIFMRSFMMWGSEMIMASFISWALIEEWYWC